MTTTETFEGVSLNLAQYAATVEKIAKINERAAKRGLSGLLVVEHGEQYTQKVCDHDRNFPCMSATLPSEHHYEERVDVRITGEAPKFAGWTFLARVDRVGESFTLATAPGVEHVSREGINLGECDHCSTNRDRKQTYIMGNEQGERVQVGSTCIKDFLGWEGSIAWLDVPTGADIENLGGGAYAEPEYPTFEVLRLAVTSVRMRGFVSTQVYGEQPTRSHVMLAYLSRLSPADVKARDALLAEAENTSDADVQAILDFITSDEFAGQSTYVENLKVLAAEGLVSTRQFGLLVSAPQAYAKHLGQVRDREAKKASEHVGTVGEKITVTATVESFRNMGSYSYNGPDSYLVTARTAEGEIVKTFTTAQWSRDAEEGDTLVLTGTVKAHEVYGDAEIKSTLLARVKGVKA